MKVGGAQEELIKGGYKMELPTPKGVSVKTAFNGNVPKKEDGMKKVSAMQRKLDQFEKTMTEES